LPALPDFQKRMAIERAAIVNPALQAQYEQALVSLDLEAFAELLNKEFQDNACPDGPVLLIVGRQDQIVDAAELLEWAKSLANADVAVLEDAGHFPNLTSPKVFNDILRRFIEGRTN
jgi:pimeloyl-ACP methyl ester carboxylesterase